MHRYYFTSLLLAILAFAAIFTMGFPNDVEAQIPEGTVYSTSSDTTPGRLYQEILSNNLWIHDSDDHDELMIDFDPIQFGGTTWGNSSTFTWTFAGSGANRPTLNFSTGRITSDGEFYVKNDVSGTNYCLLQEGSTKYNYLQGHSAFGFSGTQRDNVTLYVSDYGAATMKKAGEFYLDQPINPNEEVYPSALVSILSYTDVEFTTNDPYYSFFYGVDWVKYEGSSISDRIKKWCAIKNPNDSDDSFEMIDSVEIVPPDPPDPGYYKIHLMSEYDGSNGNGINATINPQAERLVGFNGYGKLDSSANILGLKGIVGTAEVTESGTGDVTGAAVGVRGAIEMHGTGNVGLGACLSTFTQID